MCFSGTRKVYCSTLFQGVYVQSPYLENCVTVKIFYCCSDYIFSSILQCALLYTTLYGQRRIRVVTLSLPVTSMLSNLFRAADLDTQFCCFLKQGIHLS